MDDLAAYDPLVVGVAVGKCANALHRLLKARAVDEVDGKVGVGHEGALREVRVRVDEARHDELVVIIANFGIGANDGIEILVFATRDDCISPDGHAALEGRKARSGEDGVASNDYLCFVHKCLLRRFWTMHESRRSAHAFARGAAFRAAHLVRLAESPARTLPVVLNSFTHDLPASPR